MPAEGVTLKCPGRGGPLVTTVMEVEETEVLPITEQNRVNTRVARSGRELEKTYNTLGNLVDSWVAVTVFDGGSRVIAFKSTFGSSTLQPTTAEPSSI
jgi:hypothetical protein